jgi:hypothetical protein
MPYSGLPGARRTFAKAALAALALALLAACGGAPRAATANAPEQADVVVADPDALSGKTISINALAGDGPLLVYSVLAACGIKPHQVHLTPLLVSTGDFPTGVVPAGLQQVADLMLQFGELERYFNVTVLTRR